MTESDWVPAEPDVASVKASLSDPLKALADAEIPAIVLRGIYDKSDCDGLIARFIARDLMDDPAGRESGGARKRIDIGTSLGNMGSDKGAFLDHAEQTRVQFSSLFDGFRDPVRLIYDSLQSLAGAKTVKVAQEPDGREYGPAIFRIHYEGHRYKPHIDHVTLRERRFDYAVTRFEHQFAGVLLMQNSAPGGAATQSILHRCLWDSSVQPYIDEDTFDVYARENRVPSFRATLAPGDLYFFNTRLIHEVPALEGGDPRVVLAVFIGYSESESEIFVWS